MNNLKLSEIHTPDGDFLSASWNFDGFFYDIEDALEKTVLTVESVVSWTFDQHTSPLKAEISVILTAETAKKFLANV